MSVEIGDARKAKEAFAAFENEQEKISEYCEGIDSQLVSIFQARQEKLDQVLSGFTEQIRVECRRKMKPFTRFESQCSTASKYFKRTFVQIKKHVKGANQQSITLVLPLHMYRETQTIATFNGNQIPTAPNPVFMNHEFIDLNESIDTITRKWFFASFPPVNFSLEQMQGLKKDTGGCGSGNTEFKYPYAVAVHPRTGDVYVVDNDNNCVKVFDKELNFITNFGSRGKEPGHFIQPCGIAISLDGRIAVSDWDKHSVQFFNDGDYEWIAEIANRGSGTNEMDDPRNCAFDSQGNFYIVDCGNKRVQKFDKELNFALSFGQSLVPEENWRPYGLMVNYLDEIMAVSRSSTMVHVFSSNGAYLRNISINKTEGNWNYLTRSVGNGFALSDYDQSQVTFYSEDGDVIKTLSVTNPVGICFGLGQEFYSCIWSQHKIGLYH